MNKVKTSLISDTLLRNLLIFVLGLVCLPAQAVLPVYADGKELPSLAPMLEHVTSAVVNISTEGAVSTGLNPIFSDTFFRRFFNIPEQRVERKAQSRGSGVIIDAKRGLVFTNNHVIAHAEKIIVTLSDGRQLQAELIGADPKTDVAVIKIPAEGIVAIKTADSDKLRVGDFVVSIGEPFGLGQTVTSGIVSALSRSGLGIEEYENFIQTDASINPGNSGGALVNLRGELVGISTAIFSNSGVNIGIGFAIPINLVMQIADQLLKYGRVQRGFLGISVQNLTPALIAAFGLQQHGLRHDRGTVVTAVYEGSPAGKDGLQPGDILVKINGQDVKNADDVRNSFGLLTVGQQVIFDILRAGKSKKITTVVSTEGKEEANEELVAINKHLQGLSVRKLQEGPQNSGKIEGVYVTKIERGSLIWRSGLRKGDVIISVNRRKVQNISTFLKLINGNNKSLLLKILRGNSVAFIMIK